MAPDQDAQDLPPARPAPTTRLDPPAPTTRLDGAAVNSAAGSFLQAGLEIVAPILAFLAVCILTVPPAEAISEEFPGAIARTILIVLRVWLAYKAARLAARWAASLSRSRG